MNCVVAAGSGVFVLIGQVDDDNALGGVTTLTEIMMVVPSFVLKANNSPGGEGAMQ